MSSDEMSRSLRMEAVRLRLLAQAKDLMAEGIEEMHDAILAPGGDIPAYNRGEQKYLFAANAIDGLTRKGDDK